MVLARASSCVFIDWRDMFIRDEVEVTHHNVILVVDANFYCEKLQRPKTKAPPLNNIIHITTILS
jgi:hypothetical protein